MFVYKPGAGEGRLGSAGVVLVVSSPVEGDHRHWLEDDRASLDLDLEHCLVAQV